MTGALYNKPMNIKQLKLEPAKQELPCDFFFPRESIKPGFSDMTTSLVVLSSACSSPSFALNIG